MENAHSGGSPFLPRLLHAEDLLGRVEWHADLEGRADFGMGIPLIRNHWAFYKYGDIIVDTAKIDVWWVWAVFSMLGRNSLFRISFTDEIRFTEFPQIWSDLTVSVKALAIEISWKFLSQNVPPSFAAFRRSTFLQTSLEQYYPLSSWSLAEQKGGNDLVPRSQMNCFSPVRMRDIVKLGGARWVAPFWERTFSCQKLKNKSGKDLPRVKGIVQCFFTQSISALATGHDVMGPQLATCPVPDAADQCRGSLRRLCCDLGLGQYPEFNPDPVTVRRLQYKIVTENYPSSIWSCVFLCDFPCWKRMVDSCEKGVRRWYLVTMATGNPVEDHPIRWLRRQMLSQLSSIPVKIFHGVLKYQP